MLLVERVVRARVLSNYAKAISSSELLDYPEELQRKDLIRV